VSRNVNFGLGSAVIFFRRSGDIAGVGTWTAIGAEPTNWWNYLSFAGGRYASALTRRGSDAGLFLEMQIFKGDLIMQGVQAGQQEKPGQPRFSTKIFGVLRRAWQKPSRRPLILGRFGQIADRSQHAQAPAAPEVAWWLAQSAFAAGLLA
jgi:hypothetical protein